MFSVRGCAHPDQSCPVKVGKADELAKRLTGESMFKAEPSSLAEIENWLRLLGRIFIIMRDTWEWQPRDLFDVQGMAWMVLDPESAVPEEDDDDLTGHPISKVSPVVPDNSRVAENLILYGPPGTGKTYSTAAEAVRLVDGSVPPGVGASGRQHRGPKARGEHDALVGRNLLWLG